MLCNPFGEEAIRAHRMYRVLAMQLARLGYPALRFDYSCSGDSLGDSDQASLQGWVADVGDAVAAAREKTGAQRVVVIGLRLGASVAALALEREPGLGNHLILWDPVIDGAGYLAELAHAHRRHLESELPEQGESVRSLSVPPAEVLGHPLSPQFAEALRQLELTELRWPVEHLSVISTQDPDRVRPLRERLSTHPQCEWLGLTASAAWNSDAALNDAVVPMDVLETVVASVRRSSP